MKTDLILSVARLLPALLLLFLPVGYVADSNAAQLDNIEFEWATELSREIGWFEAATGKIVKDPLKQLKQEPTLISLIPQTISQATFLSRSGVKILCWLSSLRMSLIVLKTPYW